MPPVKKGKRSKKSTDSSDSMPAKRSRPGGNVLMKDNIPSIVKEVIDALPTTVHLAETSSIRHPGATVTTTDSRHRATLPSDTCGVNPTINRGSTKAATNPSAVSSCHLTRSTIANSDSSDRENTIDQDIGEYYRAVYYLHRIVVLTLPTCTYA